MAPLRDLMICGGSGGALASTVQTVLTMPFTWPNVLIGASAGFLVGAFKGAGSSSTTEAFKAGLSIGVDSGRLFASTRGLIPDMPADPAASDSLATPQSASPSVFTAQRSRQWTRPTASCSNSQRQQAPAIFAAMGSHETWSQDRPAGSANESPVLAASCDKCQKPMTIGTDWYHRSGTAEDLCARHRSELPKGERRKFQVVTGRDVLGENWAAYVMSVRVPVDAFPQQSPRPEGKVILEACHLLNRGTRSSHTLFALLTSRLPNLAIEEVEGPRDFTRVKVDMKDEAVVCEVIKALGKQLDKKVGVTVVERIFHSPRF